MTLRCCLDGLAIELRAHDPADLAWLAEFYDLAEATSPAPATQAPITLRLVRDGVRHGRAAERARQAESGTGLTFSGRSGSLTRWTEADRHWGWDCELATAICVRAREVEVIGSDAVAPSRVTWMRVLRELHERHLVAMGARLLHAAAVSVPDGVILLAGPRKSGKSTLATYLLAHSEVAYTSNDRVALMPDGHAIGIPTVVALRDGTFSLVPQLPERPPIWTHLRPHARTLSELHQSAPPDRIAAMVNISPPQYRQWLQAELRRSGPALALIFPEVNSNPRETPDLEPLDEFQAASRLENAVIPVSPDGLLAEVVHQQAAPAKQSGLPHAYRYRLGTYRPSDAARIIHQIVATDI